MVLILALLVRLDGALTRLYLYMESLRTPVALQGETTYTAVALLPLPYITCVHL